jgi:RNase P/RNase MRP subunit p29
MEDKVLMKDFYQALPAEVIELSDRLGLGESSGSNVFRQLSGADPQSGKEAKSDKKLNDHKALILDDVRRDIAIIRKKRDNKRSKKELKTDDILSGSQRKKLFDFKGDRSGLKYEVFEQVHRLWRRYTDDLLQSTPKISSQTVGGSKPRSSLDQGAMLNTLLKADLHGARLLVIRSRNPNLVGKKGLVFQESRNTFVMINEQNKINSKFVKFGARITFLINHEFRLIN